MEQLLNFLKLNNLDWQNKTFVLAVSTGIDSSVLLDKFIKLSKKEDIKIVVAHVNHNRRAQSKAEEEYIVSYTKELGIPCFVKELTFKEDETNFQAVAHEKRFMFFNEVMEKINGDYLVLAHHAVDNIETILIRLMRGSSIAGYAGINPVYKARNNNHDYLIIRPLINLTKEEIIRYQEEENVKYFEDESNSHDDYFRNRLRHNVIPLLTEECPDIDKKFLEFSEVIRSASKIIYGIRDEYIEKNVEKKDSSFIISKKSLLKLDAYLAQEVLFELLKPLMLTTGVIKEIYKIISSTSGNFNNLVCKKLRLEISYDEVRLIMNPQEQELNELKDLYLVIDEVKDYEVNDKIKICVKKISDNYITNLWELCYNKLPLIIRTRRDGDRIKLKPGYKKINDLFIDKKIPQKERDNILLGVYQDEVLIAFGLRKSEIIKNTDCKNGYVISVERKDD